MSKQHTIRDGDCAASLAAAEGHADHKKIWNHPDNASLREQRPSPFILSKGDLIAIPERGKGQQSGACDARHRFGLRRPEARLRLRLLDEDEPRAAEPYRLEIDGRKVAEGKADGEGRLDEPIDPTANRAVLQLGEGDETERLILHLGGLSPADTIAGAQARMTNLGFECGPIDNLMGPRTERGLREFQEKYGDEVTGELDKATIEALEKEHES